MSQAPTEDIILLREILKWIRLSGMEHLRHVVTSLIDTDPKRLAYQLSTGDKGVRDIEKMTGINKDRVSELWRQWHQQGLGESVSTSGVGARFKRSFDLKMLGIKLPELQDEKPEMASKDGSVP